MTAPLHILHAIRQTTFGGGEVYVQNLALGLQAAGVRSTILTFQDGEVGQQLRAAGFEVIHIPSQKALDAKTMRQVAAVLQKIKPDLVHVHGSRAASNVLLPCKWGDLTSVYTVHGWSFHPGLGMISSFVRKLMERRFCAEAKAVVCVGHADAATGAKVLAGKVPEVIVNGIPLEPFLNVLSLEQQAHEHFTFGFIGRFTYQKYPELLADAFVQVAAKYPNARLMMVGGGELEPVIKQKLASLIDQNRVQILPYSKNVAAMLSLMDAVVLPSRWEGLSLSLIEAMAAGRYCIASDLPNNAEIITEAKTGALFKAGDVQALAAAMSKPLENPKLAFDLGNTARGYAVQNLGFERVVQENLALYQKLLKR